MSTDTTDTTPLKRGRGRPRLDPTGTQTKRSVCLSPTEVAFLVGLGGSVNRGLRTLVERAMKEIPTTSE